MNISKGLYEVITSKRLTLEQKIDAVDKFSWPIRHLDGEHEGTVELGELTKEDSQLIIQALKDGNIEEFEPPIKESK